MQIMSIAKNAAKKERAFYYDITKYPYYGDTGLNSGVLMMNLTRIREFNATKKLTEIFKQYKNLIQLGDQCLLNILFYQYPGNATRIFSLFQKKTANYFFFLQSDQPCSIAHGIFILDSVIATESVKELKKMVSKFYTDSENPFSQGQFKA